MTTQTNNQPATAPQPAPPQTWRYPFPAIDGKEVTDPAMLYRALGRMEDGFFPLGVNGFPHGGVHFGAGSARDLNQSAGVRVIANGEIVAFKLDDAYEHINFTQDHRWGMYSTGFVLVRHQMTMPPAPGSTAAQPADETLTFYSLYMHMADWQTYLADGNLVRPGWWPGVDAFRIGSKDRQTGDGGAAGAFVCKEPGGQRVAFLPKGSEVIVGEKRGSWAHIKSIASGAMIAANSGGYFGQEGGGNVPWIRPDGDEYGTAPLTQEGDWGWINYHDQQAVKEPQDVGKVVIPPEPIKVTAGTLLGQLGEYHDYERSTPLPPVPARQLLHLEVFAGDELTSFIEKSRARAAQLPADGRTILLIQVGARFVPKEVDPDLTLGQWRQLVKLTLAPNSPKVGPWIQVQPWISALGGVIHKPAGSPVWIRRDDQGRFGSPNGVEAWSRFPLQLGSVVEPANGTVLAMSHAQLDGLDKNSEAADDRGVQWWRIDFGTADNKAAGGWVCGEGHPGTTWESPWAWPGFEVVDATGINLTDAFKRNLVVCDNADWKEQSEFEPSVAAVNGNALLQRLEQTVARQPLNSSYNKKPPVKGKNGEEIVTAKKLQRAMGTPWLASELAHVILRYESEWGGGMARWDAITPLMRNARENWLCELTRIGKLQWWDDVKGKVTGFPANPVVNHIHPGALVGNFYQKSRLTVGMLRKIWPDSEVPTERLQGIAEEINANMERYSLDSELRLSHFFAQVRQEAGPKCVLDEDFRYYSPARLKALFRYFRENPSEADSYGYHPPTPANASAIANRAYANRNGNGKVVSGDGWQYRGRGLKQTTGRGNYASFNRDYRTYWSDDPQDFVANPDLLSETKYGTRSGVYFWIAHSLFTIVDQTTITNAAEKVDAITAIINKGTDSYAQRRDNFKKIIGARIFYGVTK